MYTFVHTIMVVVSGQSNEFPSHLLCRLQRINKRFYVRVVIVSHDAIVHHQKTMENMTDNDHHFRKIFPLDSQMHSAYQNKNEYDDERLECKECEENLFYVGDLPGVYERLIHDMEFKNWNRARGKKKNASGSLFPVVDLRQVETRPSKDRNTESDALFDNTFQGEKCPGFYELIIDPAISGISGSTDSGDLAELVREWYTTLFMDFVHDKLGEYLEDIEYEHHGHSFENCIDLDELLVFDKYASYGDIINLVFYDLTTSMFNVRNAVRTGKGNEIAITYRHLQALAMSYIIHTSALGYDFVSKEHQSTLLRTKNTNLKIDDLIPKDAANNSWTMMNPAGQGDKKEGKEHQSTLLQTKNTNLTIDNLIPKDAANSSWTMMNPVGQGDKKEGEEQEKVDVDEKEEKEGKKKVDASPISFTHEYCRGFHRGLLLPSSCIDVQTVRFVLNAVCTSKNGLDIMRSSFDQGAQDENFQLTQFICWYINAHNGSRTDQKSTNREDREDREVYVSPSEPIIGGSSILPGKNASLTKTGLDVVDNVYCAEGVDQGESNFCKFPFEDEMDSSVYFKSTFSKSIIKPEKTEKSHAEGTDLKCAVYASAIDGKIYIFAIKNGKIPVDLLSEFRPLVNQATRIPVTLSGQEVSDDAIKYINSLTIDPAIIRSLSVVFSSISNAMGPHTTKEGEEKSCNSTREEGHGETGTAKSVYRMTPMEEQKVLTYIYLTKNECSSEETPAQTAIDQIYNYLIDVHSQPSSVTRSQISRDMINFGVKKTRKSKGIVYGIRDIYALADSSSDKKEKVGAFALYEPTVPSVPGIAYPHVPSKYVPDMDI